MGEKFFIQIFFCVAGIVPLELLAFETNINLNSYLDRVPNSSAISLPRSSDYFVHKFSLANQGQNIVGFADIGQWPAQRNTHLLAYNRSGTLVFDRTIEDATSIYDKGSFGFAPAKEAPYVAVAFYRPHLTGNLLDSDIVIRIYNINTNSISFEYVVPNIRAPAQEHNALKISIRPNADAIAFSVWGLRNTDNQREYRGYYIENPLSTSPAVKNIDFTTLNPMMTWTANYLRQVSIAENSMAMFVSAYKTFIVDFSSLTPRIALNAFGNNHNCQSFSESGGHAAICSEQLGYIMLFKKIIGTGGLATYSYINQLNSIPVGSTFFKSLAFSKDGLKLGSAEIQWSTVNGLAQSAIKGSIFDIQDLEISPVGIRPPSTISQTVSIPGNENYTSLFPSDLSISSDGRLVAISHLGASYEDSSNNHKATLPSAFVFDSNGIRYSENRISGTSGVEIASYSNTDRDELLLSGDERYFGSSSLSFFIRSVSIARSSEEIGAPYGLHATKGNSTNSIDLNWIPIDPNSKTILYYSKRHIKNGLCERGRYLKVAGIFNPGVNSATLQLLPDVAYHFVARSTKLSADGNTTTLSQCSNVASGWGTSGTSINLGNFEISAHALLSWPNSTVQSDAVILSGISPPGAFASSTRHYRTEYWFSTNADLVCGGPALHIVGGNIDSHGAQGLALTNLSLQNISIQLGFAPGTRLFSRAKVIASTCQTVPNSTSCFEADIAESTCSNMVTFTAGTP